MLKPEHLTGNVRLVPFDRLPLAIACIQFLEEIEYEGRIDWGLPPVRSAPPAKQNPPWPMDQKARMARMALVRKEPPPVQKPRTVYVKKGDLVVDPACGRVSYRGLAIYLPANAVKLVTALARVMPDLLTFNDLSMTLYGVKFYDDAVRGLVDANAAALATVGIVVKIVPKMGCMLAAVDAG